MRTLVTGASGFLGRYVLRELVARGQAGRGFTDGSLAYTAA